MNEENEATPNHPNGWTERIAAIVQRRGDLIAVALGAVVLFGGLGSTGLWEPWEMDRADLARTLSSPPEAVAAFSRAPATSATHGVRVPGPAESALIEAGKAASVLVKQPEAGTPSALRAALDFARTNTVAAIVIDGQLLLADPGRDELWRQAGKLTTEALRSAAGASVVIVRADGQPPAAELASRLAFERWRDVWAAGATAWGLDAAWDASGVDDAARALAADTPDPLIVLEPGDFAGLEAALSAGASAVANRVAFKEDGRTIAQPPLLSWLRAAAYRIFGASEWTTRMPGALLALIALWVLVTTVRVVWGARVALFTGVVSITIPLFFTQGRIVSGEPGMMLALTLVGCGLLLASLAARASPASRDAATASASPSSTSSSSSSLSSLSSSSSAARVSPRLVWAYLVAGLITALFSKGVYALVLAGGLALVVPLVIGPSRRLADWAPAVMFFGVAALVELAASAASPGTMWAGLGFESPMFSEGPSTYSRTFDMVIRELGFGFAPWSPLVVLAMGTMLFTVLRERDRLGLVVITWFFLPIVMLMASLKLGNQFLFAGTAAAAIAVGLLLDKLVRGESGPRYFAAFALICMFYIMRRELKASPEPLVGYLAYDPPFAKEGNLRFPESVEFFWVFKQSMIIAAIACLLHFGGFARFAVSSARWLRRSRPLLITSGILLFVGSLFGLAVIGRLHGIGMSSRFANSIQSPQKALVDRLTANDPLLLIGLATLLAMIAVITARWVFPKLGARIAERLPDLDTQRARRIAWSAAAALWGAALVVASTRIIFPSDGYWSELALSGTGVMALLAAVAVGALVWGLEGSRSTERPSRGLEGSRSTERPSRGLERPRLDRVADAARDGRWWLTPAIAAAGTLALVTVAQLVRDSQLASGAVTIAVLIGFVAAATALVPRIARRLELLLFTVFALLTLVVMSYVLPLVDRAGLVTEVVLPDVANPATYGLRTLLQSIWFIGPMLAVMALLINLALPRLIASFPHARAGFEERVRAFTDRVADVAERGKLLAAVLLAVGAIGVFTHLLKLEPAIAVNVSQKHILDTWRRLAGEDAPIYKHGAFATQGRKDANFYTSDMPEIRDRQTALRVLLGKKDEVSEVETATGSTTLVFPGWNPANDADGDGNRDATAIRGFATAIGDSRLVDATRSWTPGGLVGKRLVDAAGRSWNIVANDATSVSVAPEERLSFSLEPRSRAFYVIDDAKLDASATAGTLARRALLLPADQLSDLNHAFRLISDGRHLPVLDGSSYRVLLTTSWLEPDEPQQNRLALATLDDARFAALDDPTLVREWGNFDDTIMIVGYSTDKATVSTGEMLGLTVYYKTLKLVKKSLKIFIHMDKTGGGARIAGDHWPLNPTRHTEENKNCGGCYRTDHWLIGDIVKDTYEIEIPEGNPGEYTIWIGLYQPGPDTRLPVKSWDQKRVKHDGQNRLAIGTIQIK